MVLLIEKIIFLNNIIFVIVSFILRHPLSVLNDINESVPSIIIPLSSHVSDLGAISEYDSPEMIAAKQRVKEMVLKWTGILNIEN